MKKLFKILLSTLGALLTGCASYNSAYQPTAVDEIEIHSIPGCANLIFFLHFHYKLRKLDSIRAPTSLLFSG